MDEELNVPEGADVIDLLASSSDEEEDGERAAKAAAGTDSDPSAEVDTDEVQPRMRDSDVREVSEGTDADEEASDEDHEEEEDDEDDAGSTDVDVAVAEVAHAEAADDDTEMEDAVMDAAAGAPVELDSRLSREERRIVRQLLLPTRRFGRLVTFVKPDGYDDAETIGSAKTEFVSAEKLQCLHERTWLNDEVINFETMRLNIEHDAAFQAAEATGNATAPKVPPGGPPAGGVITSLGPRGATSLRRCYCFKSYMLTKLLEGDAGYQPEAVFTWIRRAVCVCVSVWACAPR
jgi:hypothetical protein